jgi:GNAT superfamily N-acetyltransferase
MAEHLPDGWDANLPAADNLVKEYVLGYADLMEAIAAALGWPAVRTDRFEAFFRAREGGPFLLWGGFPIPDLSERGWGLMGHPPLMLRPAGGDLPPVPDGLEITPVHTVDELEEFTTTLVEAFPVPELAGLPLGGYGPALLDVDGWNLWVGRIDGRAVATAAAWVHGGLVDVEWISARPETRGRGVGAAVTWAATMADPARPAMLIASDLGQPVYERMGYLRLTRFTLWVGSR